MINARHQKAEQSRAGKCIPQAGQAAAARPKKQLQLISLQPRAQHPSLHLLGQILSLSRGLVPAGASHAESLYTTEEIPSSAAAPARMALASTQLHKLCTSLPVGAT